MHKQLLDNAIHHPTDMKKRSGVMDNSSKHRAAVICKMFKALYMEQSFYRKTRCGFLCQEHISAAVITTLWDAASWNSPLTGKTRCGILCQEHITAAVIATL